MPISVQPPKKIGSPSPREAREIWRIPQDAIADEHAYRIEGNSINQTEQCASQSVANREFSTTRELRFQLFPWPNENGLLAIMQYNFLNTGPAGACWGIGLLVHLVKANSEWQKREEFLVVPHRHTTIDRIKFQKLAPDSTTNLIIQADTGFAGGAATTLQVFGLGHGKFDELLNQYSVKDAGPSGEGYTQVLDILRTHSSKGKRFCATKTTYYSKGKWFPKPKISHPCYVKGAGVTPAESDSLAPLK